MESTLTNFNSRYSLIHFYQKILKTISNADRTQVLCSNILQQLNSSLNDVKGLENVNGFRSLLRAFAYYKELEIEVEEDNSIES
jgi:hypothetical protein